MNENRITELETKVAYQEDTIQELNQVIISMQKQLDGLEITCQALKDRVRDMSGMLSNISEHDEKPPHY